MAIYNNTNEKSVFSSVDVDDKNNIAFFFVPHEADVERARELLTKAGETVIADTHMQSATVFVTQGDATRDALFKALEATDGAQFTPETKPKQTSLTWLRENGWKIRGGSSVIGQSMTLVSAATSVPTSQVAAVEAGMVKPKFDPAIGFFAIFNLGANFINYVFGGQKERDIDGLNKFDKIIADEVNRFAPDEAHHITPDKVRKLSYMTKEEHAEYEKEQSPAGILKRNSVRLGEVGLRTLGSICMMFNIRQWPAGFRKLAQGEVVEAFKAARTKDPFTFIAGTGMVAGKTMGLLSKTYDPNHPPTTYTEELRQKILWPLSSFTEMIAQGSIVYDRAVNKRAVIGGKVQHDIAGIAGNTLLTVPTYPMRLVLPYGRKVLDVDEVQARLLDELLDMPKEERPEVAARVTARMVEHLREYSPDFGELYRELMSKCEQFHGRDSVPCATHARTKTETPTVADASAIQPGYREKITAAVRKPVEAMQSYVAATESSNSEPLLAR